MRKILFTIMIIALFAVPVSGQRYRQHQVSIIDEFGDAVTNIDIITIIDVGTSDNSTIYADRAGTLTMTNPITTGSTNSTFVQSLGQVRWFQRAPGYKITVTESGTSTSLTIDNQAEGDTRFPFYANYIGAASSLNVGDGDLLNIGTSADFTHDWDNANTRYVIAPAADGGRLDFGKAAVHTDIYWHTGAAITDDYVLFDEGSANVLFKDVDLVLDSLAVLFFGDSSDMSINYDESNNDLDILSTSALDEIAFGATGDGYDLKWWSTTAGDYALFDYSGDALLLEDLTLALGDGELLLFGDAIGTGTMSLSVSTAKLSMLQVVADTGTFDIGVAGTDIPTTWHGETSGAEVTFTGDTVLIDGIDMTIQDADILYFGDSDDITVSFSSTDFKIDAIIADEGFLIGDTTTGFDITYAFETAGQIRTDYDADFLNFTDDMELRFGTGASSDGDLKISSNSSNVLQIEQVALDTGTIEIGVTDRDIPTKWWAETAGDFVLFTGDLVQFEDVSPQVMDDTTLIFGDGSDVTMQYDEDGDNDLQVTGAVTFEGTVTFEGATVLPNNQLLRSAAVAIADTEMDNLAATPKQLVAAVAGATIEFVSAVFSLDWVSVAWTEPSAPDDLVIRYTNGSGAIVSQLLDATGFATATEDTVAFLTPTVANAAGAAVASVAVTEANSTNKGLFLHNTGSEWTNSGDSQVSVIVYYRLHTTAELSL